MPSMASGKSSIRTRYDPGGIDGLAEDRIAGLPLQRVMRGKVHGASEQALEVLFHSEKVVQPKQQAACHRVR